MKKLFYIPFLILLLVACSGSDELEVFDFTAQEFETAFKEKLDSKSGLLIAPKDSYTTDDGLYVFQINDGIGVFIDTNDSGNVQMIRVGAVGGAFLVYNKEVMTSFQTLIQTVDPSLSITQQLHIMGELGISGNSDMLDKEVRYEMNNIGYYYHGDIENDVVSLYVVPK